IDPIHARAEGDRDLAKGRRERIGNQRGGGTRGIGTIDDVVDGAARDELGEHPTVRRLPQRERTETWESTRTASKTFPELARTDFAHGGATVTQVHDHAAARAFAPGLSVEEIRSAFER